MATLYLLQGKYVGSLGVTTGQCLRRKAVVKAKIYSKRPPTETQTACVRAYECLNRISVAIAKVAWPRLGLSAKTMHKHNAVARWLKPAIRDHRFEPAYLAEIIPPADYIRLVSYQHNPASGLARIILQPASPLPQQSQAHVIAIICDSHGTVHHSSLHDIGQITIEITLQAIVDDNYHFMVFLSRKQNKRYIIDNYIYRPAPDLAKIRPRKKPVS